MEILKNYKSAGSQEVLMEVKEESLRARVQSSIGLSNGPNFDLQAALFHSRTELYKGKNFLHLSIFSLHPSLMLK